MCDAAVGQAALPSKSACSSAAPRSSSSVPLIPLVPRWENSPRAERLATASTRVASVLLEPTAMTPSSSAPFGHKRHDVLGLCQSMVDTTVEVPSAEFLQQPPFSIQVNGSRRVIGSAEERGTILEAVQMAGWRSQVSPGGSLANTLAALSRLSAAHGPPLKVSMAGSVGDDALGQFLQGSMGQAGVEVLVDQDLLHHTGTVMVFTTPDAHRSFLSFFDSGAMRMTPSMAAAIRAARLVLLEGYMLELPGAGPWVQEVVQLARAAGAQVALTAGDPTVVARHKATLCSLLQQGMVDVLFCNLDEAAELLRPCSGSSSSSSSSAGGQTASSPQGGGSQWDAQAASTALSQQASVAVVTDGSRGSHIAALGEVHHIPAHWTEKGPVDLCGAGDAYAAGVIYAISQGHDLCTAGQFASRVAATVIGRHGAQLEEGEAAELVVHLPDQVNVPAQWLTVPVV